ncbi:MAG: hypothetical protein JWP65_2520 [Ramlibacter sp.]|nr:hypothetical protein [Ramlibacter sp.]MDB5752099.1 hypothetical protein [Ramlibacter sp.]
MRRVTGDQQPAALPVAADTRAALVELGYEGNDLAGLPEKVAQQV